MTNSAKQFEMTLVNSSAESMTVCLEPWGDYKAIEPDTRVLVQAEGPADGSLEIQFSGRGITIYGWTGSKVKVFSSSGLLLDGDIPPPSIPHL
jgi:hypothetical protein